MESSLFWPCHCPQRFYQALGSSCSPSASAGMSHASLHRWPLPCSGVLQPGAQSQVSLKTGVHGELSKSAFVSAQVMFHFGALIDTAWVLVSPSILRLQMITHGAQELIGLTQVPTQHIRQVTGLVSSCHSLVLLCITILPWWTRRGWLPLVLQLLVALSIINNAARARRYPLHRWGSPALPDETPPSWLETREISQHEFL